jgi:glycosyltransferase involved in cell wall biosynthesis
VDYDHEIVDSTQRRAVEQGLIGVSSLSFHSSLPVRRCELSVVVPAYNESRTIDALVARLVPVLDRVSSDWEVIFVDDGSRDETVACVAALNCLDARIRLVSFSRNFGKEIAIAAGLDHAAGKAVVIIDADLQHPPEVIEAFVEKWREGFQVVYGERIDRKTDGLVRRKLTESFYRVFEKFGETPLPRGAGDFRLLDRKAVDALRAMPERARFSKGLYAWIGFKTVGVPFEVQQRAAGQSTFNLTRLFHFAFDGITSFSTLPLRLWTYIGVTVSFFAIMTAAFFLVRTFVMGVDVPGYASLIVSIMFFSGMQLVSLGIIGEYVGRIFAEVKRRPLYIVGESVGFEEAGAGVIETPASPVARIRRRA